jgi:hypothetical protein
LTKDTGWKATCAVILRTTSNAILKLAHTGGYDIDGTYLCEDSGQEQIRARVKDLAAP